MSPSVTIFGERFGTSTPTACLPGIGARIRISVVASAYERSSFSAATFDHLRARRELQLVARHARAGDLADDRRLDAEVRERGHERLGRALVGALRAVAGGRRDLEHGAVGQHVLPLRARDVEERGLLLGLVVRLDEQRRRLGQPFGDDVRIVVDDVDRRLVVRADSGDRPGDRPRYGSVTATAARGLAGAPDGVVRAAEHGAVRGAREQEPAGEQHGQAEQSGAGAAEQHRDPAAEHVADGAAVLAAERHHQPDERDGEPGAKGLHVEERAAEEHQPTDDDERERRDVRGRPDQVAQPTFDLLADDASLPAEVEQRGEEEADRGEAEADQLGMLVRRAGALLPRRPLLHARGRARPQRPLLLPGCHGGAFDAPAISPSSSP